MKQIEIIGYERANLGKTEAKQLRNEGNVPCVMYGGKEQVHFHSPMILFRDLVYTPDAYMVNLNIEGNEYQAILQDVQFHPVSDVIVHADFLEVSDQKPIKINIPVRTTGTAPGVQDGGKLYVNQRHLLIKALPADMPDEILLDVSKLMLGKSIKVVDLKSDGFEILTSDLISVASVETPRAMRGKSVDEELAEAAAEAALLEGGEVAEGAEGEEGAEGTDGGPAKEGGGEAPKEGGESKKDDK